MSFPKPFYRWRPHPWHGLTLGPQPPITVHAFIEITPFDTVKFEVDKETGYLRVDRPQRSSSQPPALYGFIPRTLCAQRVQALSPNSKRGDGDPLDILVNARVIGALQMIDGEEADDKIIAVLEKDNVWGMAQDIRDVPQVLVERLRHYFLTYKLIPGETSNVVEIERVLGAKEAHAIIDAAHQDYDEMYGSG